MAKKRQENSFSTFSTSALRGFILCLSARFFSQLYAAPCQSLSAFETGYPAAAKHTHTCIHTYTRLQPEPNSTPTNPAPWLLLTCFALIVNAQSGLSWNCVLRQEDNYNYSQSYNYNCRALTCKVFDTHTQSSAEGAHESRQHFFLSKNFYLIRRGKETKGSKGRNWRCWIFLCGFSLCALMCTCMCIKRNDGNDIKSILFASSPCCLHWLQTLHCPQPVAAVSALCIGQRNYEPLHTQTHTY